MSDLLFAMRGLMRTPAFTGVVVLILALGIGANTAVFSVVDAALLKRMPIRDADRLVRISGSHPQAFVWFNPRGFELWPSFVDTTSLDAVGAYVAGVLTMADSERGRVRAAAVTPEFFDVFKVAPVVGRAFSNDDVSRGSFHVAVISEELWRTRFDGAIDILGRQVVLGQEHFSIVGVMPRDFQIPAVAEVWVPSYWGSRVVSGRFIFPIVVARMATHATQVQARDEIMRTVVPARQQHAAAGAWSTEITPLRDTLVGDARGVLLLLAMGSLIVLVVASINAAGLLLTRGSARQREFGVRRALGASKRDIARQILAETLVLSAMAFAVTIPVAVWTLDAVRAWVPIRMYGATDIAIDERAIAASAMFSLLAAILFSAAPLWSGWRTLPLPALRGAAAAIADPRWRRFRSGLAVAEIALAVVLLAGAVTALRAVSALMAVDVGIRGERVLVVGLDWPADAVQPDRRRSSFARYEEAFGALPGVESVAIASGVPGAAVPADAELLLENEPVPSGRGYVGTEVTASPEYFSIMGIELLAGRVFAESDHFFAPKVAIVSEDFARRFSLRPAQIIGKRAVLDRRWVEVIGVVRDVRLGGPSAQVDATAYVPFAQRQTGGPMQIVLKSTGDPSQLIAAARATGARVDPGVPLYDIRTVDQIREGHLRDHRFVMTMLSWFGGLAFALAVIGLYGVLSYLVHLRTREIGIRMALGATTEAVRMKVIANAMGHCLAGVVIGGALALGLWHAVTMRLPDLGPLDVVTLAVVSAAFLASAALAAWVPARRATRIDPVQTLRFE